MKKVKAATLIICVLLVVNRAYAYEIGAFPSDPEHPELSDAQLDFEKNHEKLTALALYCVSTQAFFTRDITSFDKTCPIRSIEDPDFIRFIEHDAHNAEYQDYLPLLVHVRWQDDPTRMLSYKRTLAKFTTLMKGVPPENTGSCRERAREGEFRLTVDGLLCNSHYGKLQFLHAMSEQVGEPASNTRNKIDNWLRFAFSIATGQQDTSENYCDFWEGNSQYPALSGIMLPPEFKTNNWCEDRSKYRRFIPGLHPFRAWQVGTTFNLKCKNPMKSSVCGFYSSKETDVRLVALGSMLHLIQDSYSNAHTMRGSEHPEARVYCHAVQSYNGYFAQNSDKHALSDKWPDFDQSCNGSGTMDPITASAYVIWLSKHSGDEKTLPALINKIFGNAAGDTPSGAGQGYEL